MQGKGRKEAVPLVVCILLATTLACNISTPRGQATPTPEVLTIVVTATESQPGDAVSQEPAKPTGTSEASDTEGESTENSSSSGDGGSDPSIPVDSDVFTSASVKDGNASYEGKISFPGGDSSDEIYVKPVGFDSTVTSGNLSFTLTCAGRGKAKVNYKGGAVKSGSPGCGETWTVYVVNGSPDSHITIHLDDGGEVNWILSVTRAE